MEQGVKTKYTAPRFPKECGYTCIVPVSIISSQIQRFTLPYDPFAGYTTALLAAEIEPCLVWSSIKGTANLDYQTLMALYFRIFDEITKMGYKKIVVYYGNSQMSFESMPSYESMYAGKAYTLYHVKAVEEHEKLVADEEDDSPETNSESRETDSEVTRLAEIVKAVKSNALIWRKRHSKSASPKV